MYSVIIDRLEKTGVHIPEILLPAKNIDLGKWSVIACDQYTSQPEYWTKVEEIVGTSPSSFRLILPEAYLDNDDVDIRIAKINKTMEEYIESRTLVPQRPGFIYVERKTMRSSARKGLVVSVDLEQYDYRRGSQTLIRATEETVVDRVPPRMKIRKHAFLELSHIMLLVDDPEKTLIEPIAHATEKLEKLYDFELMMNGGRIKGYRIESENILAEIATALERLADPFVFYSRYGVSSDKGVLLFAVGDGNHSLASAKAHWESIKGTLSKEAAKTHPARYAMAEIVNIYDDSLVFSPIHRVLFNVDPLQVAESMLKHFSSNGKSFQKTFKTKEALFKEVALLRDKNTAIHVLPFIAKDIYGLTVVEKPFFSMEVGTLQSFLDKFMANMPKKVFVDYIHGEDVAESLGSMEGNMGFLLPPMDKNSLFKTIVKDGVLPRKTFSIGEASEKRYYLECRKIK